MRPRLDAWLQRNGWLLAGLLLLIEAATQWWLSSTYWPAQEECVPGFCSIQTEVRVTASLGLAQILAMAGFLALVSHLAKRIFLLGYVTPVAGMVVRWIYGSAMVVGGVLLLWLVLAGGLDRAHLAVEAQYIAFTVLLAAAGLNLFPRRSPPDAAPAS